MAVGCGSQYPSEQMAASQAAVRAASQSGADRVPAASSYLENARSEIAQANHWIDEGENERAAGMLLRAEADANLALTLTHEEPIQRQAREANARIEALRARSKM